MKKLSVAVLLSLAISACTPVLSLAQAPQETPVSSYERSVPDTAWQRLTKLPFYSYRNLREGFRTSAPPKPRRPSALERIIFGIIQFFGTGVGLSILWTVLIGGVLYGVWMAFFSGSRFAFAGKESRSADEDPTREDLHQTSWLQLMEEAVHSGDTRLAVRYGYLHVLQALAESARIQYRPGRTNADYIADLAGGSLVAEFRALSRTYEFTWYGSYPIAAPAFADYRTLIRIVENQTRA